MTYTAEISRTKPSCFLFVIDQSGSMDEKMENGKSKAQFVADVLNKTLAELITRCTKSEGVRDYFEVGVIGYGSSVQAGMPGELSSGILHPLSKIEQSPLRLEERVKKADDGAGGITESKIRFPVWFEPKSSGGTPMKQALRLAAETLATWCDAHPESYPPTVFHVTDGQSTDGDPEPEAELLRKLHTQDGECLLFNLHVDPREGEVVVFPANEAKLGNEYARLLHRISSPFPAHLLEVARNAGYDATTESRFFIYKAGMEFIVHFFDIGTRASQLR